MCATTATIWTIGCFPPLIWSAAEREIWQHTISLPEGNKITGLLGGIFCCQLHMLWLFTSRTVPLLTWRLVQHARHRPGNHRVDVILSSTSLLDDHSKHAVQQSWRKKTNTQSLHLYSSDCIQSVLGMKCSMSVGDPVCLQSDRPGERERERELSLTHWTKCVGPCCSLTCHHVQDPKIGAFKHNQNIWAVPHMCDYLFKIHSRNNIDHVNVYKDYEYITSVKVIQSWSFAYTDHIK